MAGKATAVRQHSHRLFSIDDNIALLRVVAALRPHRATHGLIRKRWQETADKLNGETGGDTLSGELCRQRYASLIHVASTEPKDMWPEDDDLHELVEAALADHKQHEDSDSVAERDEEPEEQEEISATPTTETGTEDALTVDIASAANAKSPSKRSARSLSYLVTPPNKRSRESSSVAAPSSSPPTMTSPPTAGATRRKLLGRVKATLVRQKKRATIDQSSPFASSHASVLASVYAAMPAPVALPPAPVAASLVAAEVAAAAAAAVSVKKEKARRKLAPTTPSPRPQRRARSNSTVIDLMTPSPPPHAEIPSETPTKESEENVVVSPPAVNPPGSRPTRSKRIRSTSGMQEETSRAVVIQSRVLPSPVHSQSSEDDVDLGVGMDVDTPLSTPPREPVEPAWRIVAESGPSPATELDGMATTFEEHEKPEKQEQPDQQETLKYVDGQDDHEQQEQEAQEKQEEQHEALPSANREIKVEPRSSSHQEPSDATSTSNDVQELRGMVESLVSCLAAMKQEQDNAKDLISGLQTSLEASKREQAKQQSEIETLTFQLEETKRTSDPVAATAELHHHCEDTKSPHHHEQLHAMDAKIHAMNESIAGLHATLAKTKEQTMLSALEQAARAKLELCELRKTLETERSERTREFSELLQIVRQRRTADNADK